MPCAVVHFLYLECSHLQLNRATVHFHQNETLVLRGPKVCFLIYIKVQLHISCVTDGPKVRQGNNLHNITPLAEAGTVVTRKHASMAELFISSSQDLVCCVL